MGLISARLNLVAQAILVGALFGWLVAGVLAAAVLVTERLQSRQLSAEVDAYHGITEGQRRARYLFELGTEEGAKELRVFGLHGWLVKRYRAEWTAAILPIWRVRRRGSLAGLLPLAGYQVLFAAALVLVAPRASRGELTVAETATVLPAVLTLAVTSTPYSVLQVGRGLTAHQAMVNVAHVISERHPGCWSRST